MKPSKRGRKSTIDPEIVRFVHEKHVRDGVAIGSIPLHVYKKFEVEIRSNIITAILNQERDTDVTGIDDLREAAIALKPKRGNRKHSDDDKKEWVRLCVEEGMSGAAIAKKFDLNSATVNHHLKKMNVERQGPGRPSSELAKPVA